MQHLKSHNVDYIITRSYLYEMHLAIKDDIDNSCIDESVSSAFGSLAKYFTGMGLSLIHI